MRVAFATRYRATIGGLEVYVRSAIAALTAARIDAALLAEFDAHDERETIDEGIEMPVWCVDRAGMQSVLDAVRDWRPDVVCIHGIEDGAIADQLIASAPSVFFALDYRGLCISGEKMHKLPAATPCHRKFGAECLLQYYPRRCGGLSPITMWREYSRQVEERDRLKSFSAIVTTSEYMRAEYARAVSPARVHKIPMLVSTLPVARTRDAQSARPRRLLFAGRMTNLKGGKVLLEALPEVSRTLGALEVTMAGDGPQRAAWQNEAERLVASNAAISIRFPGWLSQSAVAAEIARTDLLVMPSLWPEPFGLIGAEAARLGVPSAAFAVGGISEWLIDGVSGAMARGDPPSAAGLAGAILRCLGDAAGYERLVRGALEHSRRFDTAVHIPALLGIFEQVAFGASREMRTA